MGVKLLVKILFKSFFYNIMISYGAPMVGCLFEKIKIKSMEV